MGLWDWALEAYARPGVPEACLSLQDDHGQNTPLLLWAVWAEASDADLLTRAADVARRWDALAVSPIRAVRRALKPASEGVDDGARCAGDADHQARWFRFGHGRRFQPTIWAPKRPP